MEKSNIGRNTERSIDRDTFSRASGSNVTSSVEKIDLSRISVHDHTAKRACFEPIDPNR